ncbi:MAG: glycoside-pentoside-hexuronide (GPH):cation symporter [Oscillospiraceae bacterium]|jgi:melibiose permease|nr:glycoside-pentoside-hexuronide (GPH):cation symporter [Oscillospiraceae bacterium]
MDDNGIAAVQEPEKSVSWATKINYGIGAMGKSLSNGAAGLCGVYLLTVLRLPKWFLAPMNFIAKIWDGVNDLIMGVLVDNTHGKYGKFRPWIAAGASSNAFVNILQFLPALIWTYHNGLSVWCFVYVAFMALLWDATYTMVDVSYYAMIPALTMLPRERDQLAMIPRIFSGAVSIVGAFNMAIVDKLGGGEDGRVRGFLYYAILTSFIYVCTSLYSAYFVKEPGIETEKLAADKFTLAEAISILVHNKQTLITVVVMILFNMANNLTGGTAGYHFLFVMKDTTQQGFYSIIAGAGNAVGLLGFPFFTKLFGREKAYTLSFLVPCLGYAVMAAVSNFATGMFIPFAVSGLIACTGYGMMSVMQSVMLADSVDYGEYNTGLRNEGIIFSTLTMLSKMAGALSGLVQMLVFMVVKFGGEDAVTATPLVIKGFAFLMYILPPILLLTALLIYKTQYKLSEPRMAEIRAALAARKGEN